MTVLCKLYFSTDLLFRFLWEGDNLHSQITKMGKDKITLQLKQEKSSFMCQNIIIHFFTDFLLEYVLNNLFGGCCFHLWHFIISSEKHFIRAKFGNLNFTPLPNRIAFKFLNQTFISIFYCTFSFECSNLNDLVRSHFARKKKF